MPSARAITVLGIGVVAVTASIWYSRAAPGGWRPGSGPNEEQIHFESDGVRLAGTLFVPPGNAPHPAVVLFHGSGPQRRDNLTARWFAEHGVEALTYDKRGTGDSTGDFQSVPFMTLCDDGLAAVHLLESRREADPHRIGVWGLSQGGWLAPLAASRSRDIAFVIAVSGPGVSPGEQMIFYWANDLRAQGLPERSVEAASALRREIWNYQSSGKNYDQVKADLERARKEPWFGAARDQQDHSFGPLPVPRDVAVSHDTWFKQEMTYDPTIALKELEVPTLFIFGAEDELVPVPESVRIIRSELERSGKRDFTIRVLPHTAHNMRIVGGATDGEISPEYLQTMQTWLSQKGF
jgi:uncharacterized protein